MISFGITVGLRFSVSDWVSIAPRRASCLDGCLCGDEFS